VDPDVVVWLGDLHNGHTKGLINLFVGLPVSVLVYRVQGKIVEEWPNGFVAKAVIKILNISCGKKDSVAILFPELI